MDFESLLEHYKVAGRLAEKQRYAAEFVTTLRPFQIIIYGAGAAGVSLLRSLRLHNIEPLFFVDRRWQECESTEGLAMRGPEALREVDSPDTLVILAINAEVIRRFNQGPLDNIQNYSPHAAVIRTGIPFHIFISER